MLSVIQNPSPTLVLRQMFNKLIFDPNSIVIDKSHLLKQNEDTILSMYDDIIRETHHLNFDALSCQVIEYNHSIIQKAASLMWNTPDDIPEAETINLNLLRCDTGRWIQHVFRMEVSASNAPITDYLSYVLTKHGRAFIPFMESTAFRMKNTAGITGTVVVNDCQNMLFRTHDELFTTIVPDIKNTGTVCFVRPPGKGMLCERNMTQ